MCSSKQLLTILDFTKGKLTQTRRPPLGVFRILIAMKLQGMKEIEKTSEHIEIIILFTPNRLLLNVAIGMKAT